MSDEGTVAKPEHAFKKLIWRSVVSMSEAMDHATTWSITGIAAIAGLLITKLDAVGQLVSRSGLRWALFLFTASILFGAFSKQYAIAITKGLAMIDKLESLLWSEQGQALMIQMTTPPRQLIEEIASPFWWPLSSLMRKGGIKGLTDYLSTDKRFITLFQIHLILVYLHGLFGIAGFVVIAASILP